eukprot:9404474-Lingulodinium_polyedra.AAC.1
MVPLDSSTSAPLWSAWRNRDAMLAGSSTGATQAPQPHGEASVQTISAAKRTRRSKKRYGRMHTKPST